MRDMKRQVENNTKSRNKDYKKYWCRSTLLNHKYRGNKVELTFDVLHAASQHMDTCAICGCKLKWNSGEGQQSHSPTLDRIDNSNIITEDNFQIVCHLCNRTKSNRTMKEFVEYCGKIYFKHSV